MKTPMTEVRDCSLILGHVRRVGASMFWADSSRKPGAWKSESPKEFTGTTDVA